MRVGGVRLLDGVRDITEGTRHMQQLKMKSAGGGTENEAQPVMLHALRRDAVISLTEKQRERDTGDDVIVMSDCHTMAC